MNPVVISPSRQEFAGLRFYKRKSGYYYSAPPHPQVRLQRMVWSEHYGNIPHGWEVHHKDENRDNNELGNLECLAPMDHRAKHREQRVALVRVRNARSAAFVCQECGKPYEGQPNGRNRWCSRACETRNYKRRRKA